MSTDERIEGIDDPINPDFYLVRIKDEMGYWCFEVRDSVPQVYTVYLVNRNWINWATSTQANYELEPLYSYGVDSTGFGGDISEELRDMIDQGFDESYDGARYYVASEFEQYFNNPENVYHITDQDISKITDIDEDWLQAYHAAEETDAVDAAYRPVIEALSAYFRSNIVL